MRDDHSPCAPSQARDYRREILIALTHKVRFFTCAQVARTWWPGRKTAQIIARRQLTALARAGFVESSELVAHPELALSRPVLTWNPEEPHPNFDQTSYRLQSRWTEPNATTRVFFASTAAKKHFGGFGGYIPHPHQATHDLHVATIYCLAHTCDPRRAGDWVGEDLLPKPQPGDKLPDAMLRTPAGQDYLLIEFGGAYDAARVAKLHHHCCAIGIAYELW